jgi:hypothetical protein
MSLNRYGEDGQIETLQKQPLSPKPDEEVIISERTGKPEVRKKLQEPTPVPQAEHKQQTAPQKSSPPTQAKPKKQEKFYFTREMLHREEQRVKNQSKPKRKQEVTVVENKKAARIPELEAIETWAAELTEEIAETSDDAKRDERVMLMATSVIKMCRLLKNFSEVMTAEMAKSAERELQTLNLQDQYAKSLRASTVEVSRDIYDRFKEEQKKAFDDVKTFFSDSCDEMEKKLNTCTENVNLATARAGRASKRISKSVKRFCTVKTIGDVLYYVAPVAVVIDVLLRLFDFI